MWVAICSQRTGTISRYRRVAGVLVAGSNSANVARVITIPLRDMLAAIFFISIGALIDLSHIPVLIIPTMLLILTSFASMFLIITAILAATDRL